MDNPRPRGGSPRDLKRFLRSRRGEMVRLLRELVLRESPTHDKKAVDSCTTFIAEAFKKSGLSVSRIPAADIGDLCLVEWKQRNVSPGLKPLLLLTHSDTVWPTGQVRSMPFRVRGDRIFGPGVLDMKSGLVQAYYALEAIRRLRLRPRRPVKLLINSAEETGSPSANRIIRALSKKAAAVLCLEPALPGGALKVQRKGRLVVRLDVSGKYAHAGSPRGGVNAIEELMHQLLALRRLRRGGTTLNIGRVEGGGPVNVVAARASAILDFRFWRAADQRFILEELKSRKPALPGAGISFRAESTTPPMERTLPSRRLFTRVRLLAAELGIRLSGGKTGGGSDASLASSLGLPTLDGLGPEGDGIHAENEHVRISSLIERAALLAHLLLNL